MAQSRQSIDSQITLMKDYVETKEYTKALKLIKELETKKLILSIPIKLLIERMKVRCSRGLGLYEEALIILTKLINKYPSIDDVEKDKINEEFARYWLDLFDKNDQEESSKNCEFYLNKLPKRIYTKRLWIRYYDRKKEYGKAIALIEELKKECKDDPQTWQRLQIHLTDIYKKTGLKKQFLEAAKQINSNTEDFKAKQLLIAAGLIFSEHTKAPVGEASYELVSFAFLQEKESPEEAEKTFNKLLKERPYEWKNYIAYAVHLQLFSEDWERSIQILSLLESYYKEFCKNKTISTFNRRVQMPSKRIWLLACTSYAIAYYNMGQKNMGDRYAQLIEKHHAPAFSAHAKFNPHKSHELNNAAYRLDPGRFQRLHGQSTTTQKNFDIFNLNDFPSLMDGAAKKIEEKEVEEIDEAVINQRISFIEKLLEENIKAEQDEIKQVPIKPIASEQSTPKTWEPQQHSKNSLSDIMKDEEPKADAKMESLKGKFKFNRKKAISLTSGGMFGKKESNKFENVSVQSLQDQQTVVEPIEQTSQSIEGQHSEQRIEPLSTLPLANAEIQENEKKLNVLSIDHAVVAPVVTETQAAPLSTRNTSFCSSIGMFAVGAAVVVAAATTYCINDYMKKM